MTALKEFQASFCYSVPISPTRNFIETEIRVFLQRLRLLESQSLIKAKILSKTLKCCQHQLFILLSEVNDMSLWGHCAFFCPVSLSLLFFFSPAMIFVFVTRKNYQLVHVLTCVTCCDSAQGSSCSLNRRASLRTASSAQRLCTGW